jgi:peptide/nickel transport system substrate-binding protein
MSGEERSGVGRRRFLSIAGGAAGTAALAGCSGVIGNGATSGNGTETSSSTTTGFQTTAEGTEDGEPDDGKGDNSLPVHVTQGQFPSTLDPHDHRQTPTDNVLLHCYEGLLSTDRHGRIVEGLATGYERLEDGNEVRFEIREDVQFHDGSALTPADAAFSVNRVVDEGTGFQSPQRSQLDGVTGATVAEEGRAVRVSSAGANPVVFTSFANYCDVLSKEWVESHDRSFLASNALGTGPFRLETYESGERVVLSRFDGYWNEPAEVTEVTFTAETDPTARVDALLEGESDVAVNVPPAGADRINSGTEARLAVASSTRIVFAAMRHDTPPFDSAKFRRALNYAVDLSSIVGNVLQGFGEQTGQPTLEEFTGHNPDLKPYPYDRGRAEDLIEQSGYAGAEITLHVPTGRYLKGREIARSVVGYVNELSNVSASLEPREFDSLLADLLSPRSGDVPDWYLVGWGEPAADAAFVLRPLLTSDGRLSTWSNDRFDRLLRQAGERSGSERAATLSEANRLAHDRAPWVFLNRQYSVYGVRNRIAWEARSDECIDAYRMRRADRG